MITRPKDLKMSEPELLLEIISLFIDDQLLESHTITEMLRPSFYRLSPSQLRVLMRRDPVAVDSRNEREVHSYEGG